MVMFENGLKIRPTRPRPRGTNRFMTMRLADVGVGHDQIVDVEIVIVLGIGDRRFQALANVAGDPLLREFEIGQRARDLLAADQARDQVELLRADAQIARQGHRLAVVQCALARRLTHDASPHFRLAFLSAAWPWNVRVGENSPNLCPTMSSVTYTGTCFLPL